MYQEFTIQKDSTNVVIPVRVIDSSTLDQTDKTTGRGLTGLLYNASSFTAYYMRQDDGDAAGTAITLATATRGSFTSGGWIEKDSTNMTGEYEFGIPDAAVATGSAWCRIAFRGASNLIEATVHIHLVDETASSVKAVADLTASLTESYSTDGSAATAAQMLYGIKALLGEFAKSGGTITTKKVDGSTTAETYTLDDGTNPTSITRAS